MGFQDFSSLIEAMADHATGELGNRGSKHGFGRQVMSSISDIPSLRCLGDFQEQM